MILQKLNELYYRLSTKKDASDNFLVPPFGFSDEKISYCIVLSKEGSVIDIQDVRETSGKKVVPKLMSVPRPEKRTSGVKSNFLWDKTAYVLGIEGNKDKATAVVTPYFHTEKTFEAFKRLHLENFKNTNDVELKALVSFLCNWESSHFLIHPFCSEMIDSNLVFKLDGKTTYIHENIEARKIWANHTLPNIETQKLQCLVTGEFNNVARLHAPIKGVYGGQAAGASIVAFNAESYCSFLKEQGDNAPISEAASFAYTTALNYMLRRENGHCISIGDTSTVFWALAEETNTSKIAEDLFSMLLNANQPTDSQEHAKLVPILEKISKGKPIVNAEFPVAKSTEFFILGLAPNASRISIRFWLNSDFGHLTSNLTDHFQDLHLLPVPWTKTPSIWQLLIEMAPLGDRDRISPLLSGEFFRSVISGYRYPRAVLTQVVQRFRSDGKITGIRVSMIKAVLAREYRLGFIKEGISMSLDLECKNQAYRLGRLFATLEKIQFFALGDVNTKITDKYYGAASSVPYSVFPRLLAGSKHHLSTLRKDKPGLAMNLNKDVAEIISGLPNEFQKHFSIEDQGRFAIGFFHQQQAYFQKKVDETVSKVE